MKKYLLFAIVVVMFLFSSCSNEVNVDSMKNNIIPVEVKTLTIEESDDTISYIGILNSDVLKKYAFKTSGKLKTINVQVGQEINAGDILIELDKTDLQFQVDATKMQTSSALSQYEKALSGAQVEDLKASELNVEKAQTGYDYAKKSFENIKTLYEKEAVSETNFKEAELNYNIASMELEQAKELLKKAESGSREEDISSLYSQYELAKTNYDATMKLYNDATIISDISGYIADILYKTGEIVPEGYPAILVQSKKQVINIGVTSEDIEKLSIGMTTKININDELYEGKIININQTPDANSRTFNVDIVINNENKKFYIGTICNVEIITGTTKDIWLEIPLILNDGKHYVYVVENNTAVRKDITINKIKNQKASVAGLSDKDILITNGVKQIKNGYKVQIVNNK